MEVHPIVRGMMERAAPSPEVLAAWLAHHETVTLEQVEAAQDADERDELADTYGWEV